MEDVKEHRYEPNIITRGREPVEFSCFRLTEYVGSDDAVEATNSTVATDSAGNAGFAGADANESEYTMQHFSSIWNSITPHATSTRASGRSPSICAGLLPPP